MMISMSGKTEVAQSQLLAGLEFIKLGRMERYLLNEFIARMDSTNNEETSAIRANGSGGINPGSGKSSEAITEGIEETGVTLDEDDESDTGVIWRGNRRRHYRVDLQSVEFFIELDFRPVLTKIYPARVVNISTSGCLAVLPADIKLHERDKIPWLRIPCNGKTIVCRAVVVHTRSI
jgi:hypothetical protein